MEVKKMRETASESENVRSASVRKPCKSSNSQRKCSFVSPKLSSTLLCSPPLMSNRKMSALPNLSSGLLRLTCNLVQLLKELLMQSLLANV